VDKTKPGHRKILVFFLVNPQMADSVPSTSNVPPQQKSWGLHAVHTGSPDRSLLSKLPVEVRNMIVDAEGSQMSLEEAKKYRLELMNERTVFVEQNDEEYFRIEFNMCEQCVILVRPRPLQMLFLSSS
jgi:hypothetical protein